MSDYAGMYSKESFQDMMDRSIATSKVGELSDLPEEYLAFVPNAFVFGWEHLTLRERAILISCAKKSYWEAQGR